MTDTPETAPGTKLQAFKAFDKNMTCRGFQYELGKTYHHDGEISMCEAGFHACTVPFDCWNYYEGSATFARVELNGVSDEIREDSKRVAASITIQATLTLPEWIKTQAAAVVELCRSAKGALASEGHAASTGNGGHAASTGDRGHAASTGDRGHAASTGHEGHAASTGNGGHAASTGNWGHAASTGHGGHAASTGYGGHAASTGDRGHAASTGDRGHAASTGYGGHAASTGYGGHASAKGENSIASSIGFSGTAEGVAGTWLVLACYDDDFNVLAVRTVQVDGEQIKPDTSYRLVADGDDFTFQEAN